jgi:hypothetical protein
MTAFGPFCQFAAAQLCVRYQGRTRRSAAKANTATPRARSEVGTYSDWMPGGYFKTGVESI